MRLILVIKLIRAPLPLDGWDIYRSSYVTIEDSIVHNDDDYISSKPNMTNTIVRNPEMVPMASSWVVLARYVS